MYLFVFRVVLSFSMKLCRSAKMPWRRNLAVYVFLSFLNFPYFFAFFSIKTLQAGPDVTMRWMFFSLFRIFLHYLYCLYFFPFFSFLLTEDFAGRLAKMPWRGNLAVYVFFVFVEFSLKLCRRAKMLWCGNLATLHTPFLSFMYFFVFFSKKKTLQAC